MPFAVGDRIRIRKALNLHPYQDRDGYSLATIMDNRERDDATYGTAHVAEIRALLDALDELAAQITVAANSSARSSEQVDYQYRVDYRPGGEFGILQNRRAGLIGRLWDLLDPCRTLERWNMNARVIGTL